MRERERERKNKMQTNNKFFKGISIKNAIGFSSSRSVISFYESEKNIRVYMLKALFSLSIYIYIYAKLKVRTAITLVTES